MLTITAKVADRTPIYLKCTSDYGRNYGTRRQYVFGWNAARSKTAWWIVFDRYSGAASTRRDYPKRYTCDCYDERGNSVYHDGYDDPRLCCEIHSPTNGYLRRLHDRVVRWLAAGYMLPDSGLKEG